MTLVVEIERAAPVDERSVIDDGHAPCGDALADAARKCARALAVEVTLEAVTDRLVQQDARPAVAQHHRHVAGRCIARRQIDQRLVDRLFREQVELRVGEVAVIETRAATRIALLAAPAFLDDDRERDSHQGPHVGRKKAIAASDQHRLVLAGQRSHHLHDARVERTRATLEARQHRHFIRIGQAHHRIGSRIEPPRVGAPCERRRRGLSLASDRTHGVRRFLERCKRYVVRIRERLLVARDGAHADAGVDVERAGLDDAFLETPAFEARMLEIEIGEVDVVRVDRAQHARHLVEIEIGGCEQQSLGIGEQRCGNLGVCDLDHGIPFSDGSIGSRRAKRATTADQD